MAKSALRTTPTVLLSSPMSDDSPANGSERGDITLLLRRAEAGDASAAQQILPLVYDELRKLATAKMAREAGGLTLQPTALVHEAWLRLGGDQQPEWENRAQFFAAAAEGMRRILIENARRRRAARHGGKLEKISVDAESIDLASPAADEKLLLIHEALERLAAVEPRKAELVKQRFFVGLRLDEIAAVMGISETTAKRDWSYARAWLMTEIQALRD